MIAVSNILSVKFHDTASQEAVFIERQPWGNRFPNFLLFREREYELIPRQSIQRRKTEIQGTALL